MAGKRACISCSSEFTGGEIVCPHDGTTLTPLAQDTMVGRTLADRYQILEIIGGGGMGQVYKARHVLMNRIVAIKVLHAHLVTNADALKRFQLEAQAASCLSLPNILTVYDFGLTPEGHPYMVMDFLEGTSLESVLDNEGRISVERALRVFSQVCAGLAHAHQKGVVHRDIKPSNIMLVNYGEEKDFVKIVDFGIAKLLNHHSDGPGGAANLTRTGEVFGSPNYMSPEQCRGQSLDIRSDIYSLGCVMYKALTGRTPIQGKDIIELLFKQVSETAKPFREVCPELELPAEIEFIVFKAIAKEPDERFQNMSEFKAALDACGGNALSDRLQVVPSAMLTTGAVGSVPTERPVPGETASRPEPSPGSPEHVRPSQEVTRLTTPPDFAHAHAPAPAHSSIAQPPSSQPAMSPMSQPIPQAISPSAPQPVPQARAGDVASQTGAPPVPLSGDSWKGKLDSIPTPKASDMRLGGSALSGASAGNVGSAAGGISDGIGDGVATGAIGGGIAAGAIGAEAGGVPAAADTGAVQGEAWKGQLDSIPTPKVSGQPKSPSLDVNTLHDVSRTPPPEPPVSRGPRAARAPMSTSRMKAGTGGSNKILFVCIAGVIVTVGVVGGFASVLMKQSAESRTFKESMQKGSSELNAGNLNVAQIELDAAMKEAQRLNIDDPSLPPLLFNLGKAFHAKGEWQKAIDSLQASIVLFKKKNPQGSPEIVAAEKLIASATTSLNPPPVTATSPSAEATPEKGGGTRDKGDGTPEKAEGATDTAIADGESVEKGDAKAIVQKQRRRARRSQSSAAAPPRRRAYSSYGYYNR